MSNRKSLLKSGISLSLLTLISRILGLVREGIKSAFLGTGPLADAFTVAFMIPNLLRRIFAENTMTVAFIPTFQDYLGDDRTRAVKTTEVKTFLSACFTLFSFAATAAMLLGMAGSGIIVSVFFPKIADFTETVFLTRIMFPYLLLISVAAFFQGILNGVRIFLASGLTPILFNLAVISSTMALAKPVGDPALAMSIGVVIGGTLQMLFQLPFVLRAGFTFRVIPLKKVFANKGTQKIFRLIIPTLIGTAVYQINDLVSTALATYSGVGVASSLQYSIRLQELILGIFAVSVGTVILPDLSAMAAQHQWKPFQQLLLNAAQIIAFITIPAAFFLLFSGEHLIILVYKTRLFNDESVRLTLEAFRWHIAGLFFIAFNRILTAAFYAQSDTKSPTVAGIICFTVNIIFAALLAPFMGCGGIAAALSIASAVNTGLLFFFLQQNKQIEFLSFIRRWLPFVLRMVLFSCVAALPCMFLQSYVYTPFAHFNRIIAQGIPLALSALLFAILVILEMLLTKDPFLTNFAVNVLQRITRRRK